MLRLILPISAVPDDSEVTKPTGNVVLRVKRIIKVYGDPAMDLEAKPGTAFLVSDRGGINAVPDHTEVSVNGDAEELIEYLQDMQLKERERTSK